MTNPFSSLLQEVKAVNAKYARPGIVMTPLVKVCLFALRAYLLVLVGLMVYKFIEIVK